MPTAQVYRKPPVSEALIDIRIDPLPPAQEQVLQNLHEQLQKVYPNKRSQKKWEGFWEVREDSIASAQKAHGTTGYLFESEDKKRIVQYRLDGFTLNFLKPDPYEAWPGWEELRNEAKRAWVLYAKALEVREITEVSVRYINKIVIPGPVMELRDYLTIPPDVPQDFEYQHLTDFLSRVKVAIPDLNATATITQAPTKEFRQDGIAVLLDIEITRAQRVQVTSDFIWPTLDRFREIKNSIFEKSLQPRAKELFK